MYGCHNSRRGGIRRSVASEGGDPQVKRAYLPVVLQQYLVRMRYFSFLGASFFALRAKKEAQIWQVAERTQAEKRSIAAAA
jgi:hypothetical protein